MQGKFILEPGWIYPISLAHCAPSTRWLSVSLSKMSVMTSRAGPRIAMVRLQSDCQRACLPWITALCAEDLFCGRARSIIDWNVRYVLSQSQRGEGSRVLGPSCLQVDVTRLGSPSAASVGLSPPHQHQHQKICELSSKACLRAWHMRPVPKLLRQAW
jgi:hypothetical protein